MIRHSRAAAFAACLIFLAHAAAAATGPASGNYDGLLIAYDAGGGAVTGGYNEMRGNGQFSCIFLFKGKIGPHGVATVETVGMPGPDSAAADPPIKGTLSVTGTKATLRFDGNPPGCDMEGSDFSGKTDAPAARDLTAPYPWHHIALARRDRTHFYVSDDATVPRKAYLVDLDVVGVRTNSKGRSLIDYVSSDRVTSGWVSGEDLYP